MRVLFYRESMASKPQQQEWPGDAEEVERRIRRNGLDPGLRLRRLALQLISVKTIDPAFTVVGES